MLRHAEVCFEHYSRSPGKQYRQLGENGGNALRFVARE
jgi:hypothetical protein